MKLSESKERVLELISSDSRSAKSDLAIDAESPDGESGQIHALRSSCARHCAVDGFFININLAWFAGSMYVTIPKISTIDN